VPYQGREAPKSERAPIGAKSYDGAYGKKWLYSTAGRLFLRS